MPATPTKTVTFTLTDEERTQLLGFLEPALRETMVEVHRTESSDFRAHVECKQNAIQKLFDAIKAS